MSIRGVAKYIPAFAHGHRVYPEHIAGMIGLPHVGTIIYVDPTNGSDTANAGRQQDDAYATVVNAEDDTVSGQHDVVVIAPESGSGRTTEASQLVWDKRFTHLIGSGAPLIMDPRAGMSFAATATTPSMTISNNGCIFSNITIAQFNDVNVLVSLTGDYNYFGNVHFAGMGNATTGDDAAGRCVDLSGSDENLFENCTIGLDTVARSTTNASVEFSSGCARNQFRSCLFPAYADNNGVNFVLANAAADLDRFVLFENCIFHNAVNSGASTITEAMDTHAAAGGSIILHNSWLLGATDWADDFTVVEGALGGQSTGATHGLMQTVA